MADEEQFEPFHVPQQSRRDKLRVVNNTNTLHHHHHFTYSNHHHHLHQHNHNQNTNTALFPLFDPSLISSSDLINLHRQNFTGVKEEGINLMGFMSGGINSIIINNNNNNNNNTNNNSSSTTSSSTQPTNQNQNQNQNQIHHQPHPMFGDPQLNPNNSIQEINGGPFLYNFNNSRPLLDQSFHGGNNNNNNITNNDTNETPPHHHHHHHHEPNSNVQSLSLSLSSHHNNQLPLELNLQRYDSSVFNTNKVSGLTPGSYLVNGAAVGSTSLDFSRSSVPLGPFTDYASVLNGSRFLKPAQQLLEELCDVGREIYAEKISEDSCLLDPAPQLENLSGNNVDDSLSSVDAGEQTRKKSGLLTMLDEVYKRYKMYYQQVQAVVASFESVAGLSNAAPFANLALKALTKHFRCLKNAITDQLQFSAKSQGKGNYERDETQIMENLGKGNCSQRSFHQMGFVEQPVWRPQRGLPERAVTVLRAWLFEHFLHPYPTDTDKLMLAKQTGLSRNQVSNWFINARVRLWKPMVEEIHTLETRQKQSQRDPEPPTNRINDHLPTSCSFDYDNASTSSIPRLGEFPLKRNREELHETARGNEGPMNMPYENLSHLPHIGVGVGNNASGSGGGGVSLTLGLHQTAMGLSEAYPMAAARRFGLDPHSEAYGHGEGYVLSGFGTQNRQFGRDIIG